MTEPSLPPASDEARLQLELSGPISLPALSTELPGLELVDASSEPEPEAIPEEAPPPEEAPAEEPSPESNEAYAEAAAPEEPEAASAEEPAFTDELEEAEFLIQQDSLDDAREALNTILAKAPNHAGALALLQTITPPVEEAAPPPPEPAPAPEPESGGFDLGRELADEFAAFDAPGSEAKLGEKTPDASRGMLDLGGVKLETKVAQEDSQTHFDLGIAYKEMGMFDEALHEFEVAQKGTGSRHVLDCLMMIGLCHIERGDAPKALEQFKAALKTPGLTLAASKELHYEIAHCHEMVGEKQLAIDHLSRVFKADPAYRDTKMRLATLMGKVKSPGSIAPSISGKPKSPKSIAPGKVKAPKSIAPKSVAPKVQNGTSHPPEIEPEPSPDVPPEPPRGSPSRAGGRRKIGYI